MSSKITDSWRKETKHSWWNKNLYFKARHEKFKQNSSLPISASSPPWSSTLLTSPPPWQKHPLNHRDPLPSFGANHGTPLLIPPVSALSGLTHLACADIFGELQWQYIISLKVYPTWIYHIYNANTSFPFKTATGPEETGMHLTQDLSLNTHSWPC